MNKSAEKRVERAITRKRLELKALRSELEDLFDYLDVLEARTRDLGRPRLSHEEVKKRYGARSERNARPRTGRVAA